MATLLLTAVGTAVGGPIGGAVGALAGRQIDGRVFGGGRREGPRVKDLAISTSSYGTPIAKHFGKTRAAGTIIWSTDLAEKRETSGGGKGKPKTTSYSYSVSFAVALASSPVDGIGRIWADGNLLRGASGDLKTGGRLRIYNGWGDQPADPLIASAEGSRCPAFRNLAYVVFEDLQLADFGNRIPALSFEIIAGPGSSTVRRIASCVDGVAADPDLESSFAGFAWEGGSLGETLAAIDAVEPLSARLDRTRLAVGSRAADPSAARLLSPATSSDEEDFGAESGFSRSRSAGLQARAAALRYYDIARDYQPGSQRALGRSSSSSDVTIELPASLDARAARQLIDRAASRGEANRETLSWRAVAFDPSIRPGSHVVVPGLSGRWLVDTMEWRANGVEYSLRREARPVISAVTGESGRSWSADDLAVTPTVLRAFELPPGSPEDAARSLVYAAASSVSAGWPGASFFAERAGTLTPLEVATRRRSICGTLLTAMTNSPALRLEAGSSIDVEMLSTAVELQTATPEALAQGANRLLVGDEVLQFLSAEPLHDSVWRLSGLLRGRGGTESAAAAGHQAGTAVTVFDDSLVSIDADLAGARLAAIGPADETPVVANIESRGLALRPLTPVHPRVRRDQSGIVRLSWIRRARGAWSWRDAADVPLVEEAELYRLGIGPTDAPLAEWSLSQPVLVLDEADWSGLVAQWAGQPIWVRQVGDHAQSKPLLLGQLA